MVARDASDDRSFDLTLIGGLTRTCFSPHRILKKERLVFCHLPHFIIVNLVLGATMRFTLSALIAAAWVTSHVQGFAPPAAVRTVVRPTTSFVASLRTTTVPSSVKPAVWQLAASTTADAVPAEEEDSKGGGSATITQ